ncbi:MAG: tyrosine-type recombinase/integrase [Actinomycetota bacterium]|nr:tyrosine-type recombinase/integrase [Actinomycetota bacterium]
MRGSLFKRCIDCGRVVQHKRCGSCGSRRYNWGYAVDIGTGADGRRRQQRRNGFETAEEAERALREVISAIDKQSFVEPSQLTLGEYLTEHWLPAVRPPQLRNTTWVEYDRMVRLRMLPELGQVPLQKLNAAQLNRLYAHLLVDGRADGTGGLSVKSVRETHVVLRKALEDAMRWGMVQRNVAALADPPPAHAAAADRRDTMAVWSEQQLARFLRHAQDHDLYPLWALLASTGMRRSEALGLPWRDVDFDGKRLSVRQGLVSVDGTPELGPPKSRHAVRTIDLDDRTIAALRQQRRRQNEQRLAAKEWTDTGLVFTRPDGSWLHPDWIGELFRRLVDEAGLPAIRMHDLRHTHATLLLRWGHNPKVVSERLGHHSVAFTLDTYAHVVPGMQQAVADEFGNLLPEVDDGDDNGLGGVPAIVPV